MAKRSLSVLKAARQNERRRQRNRKRRLALKTAVKKVRQAQTKEEALKLMVEAQSVIDRAAKQHIIHRNTANRLKSRLAHEISLML
ncbi:MAG: 30S ribosomal protein S20 [candidate division WOR-3 bacterium]